MEDVITMFNKKYGVSMKIKLSSMNHTLVKATFPGKFFLLNGTIVYLGKGQTSKTNAWVSFSKGNHASS